jgi:hypothetical protein
MLTFLVSDFKVNHLVRQFKKVREVYGNYEVNKDSFSV